MIKHEELGVGIFTRSRQLKKLIFAGEVTFGGNSKLKIYGTLDCSSGKRMKAANRVFFLNEAEALTHLYRPCGHCLREKYQTWKMHQIQQSNTAQGTLFSSSGNYLF